MRETVGDGVTSSDVLNVPNMVCVLDKRGEMLAVGVADEVVDGVTTWQDDEDVQDKLHDFELLLADEETLRDTVPVDSEREGDDETEGNGVNEADNEVDTDRFCVNDADIRDEGVCDRE